MTSWSRGGRVLASALCVLALSACIVAPLGYDGYYGDPVAESDVAPPAPYGEVRPVLPYAGALWIGGYWGWGGGRHYWVPGRWDHPRAGYAWRPHQWRPYGNHWRLHGGGWVRGR